VNRLAAEASRYLRQHAAQPVDWYPWGPEALGRAATEDRPLFISIGYSACHWCHVMAHESFDDPDVAAALNDAFVAVKVDREERPDIDAVYMEAVQAMTGQGGWPMSIFATPDGRPFFTGTYFPRHDRAGMPGFDRVLEAVSDAWHHRRSEVDAQATELADAIARRSRPAPPPTSGPGPWPGLLHDAVGQLHRRLDTTHGGFGPAPKFPQPALVELACLHRHLTGDPLSAAAVTTTLGAMAAGGIYDHLGGGFARYSTDTTWTVPHFEKMLYDQAGLVRAYLHAWLVDADPRWRQVVEETVAYVLGDLALPDGGLASSRDADSEGEEGRYYVWSSDELQEVLGGSYPAVASWYQVDGAPAFEGRHILRRPVGGQLERPAEVEAGRGALLAARDARTPPGRDDKVVTEWTAMFVGALAEAAGAMGQPMWAQAAEQLGDFLWHQLRRAGDGRLMRTWQAGTARHLGVAADHAAMVDACTRLAELTGRAHWLDRAGQLAEDMLGRFATGEGGLLATTGDDADVPVTRPVEVTDGATASASSLAAGALIRLGALRGDQHLAGAGSELAQALAGLAREFPLAMAHAVAVAVLAGTGTTEVLVTGARLEMLGRLRRRYEPSLVTLWGERGTSALWTGRPDDGAVYVCRNATCRYPLRDPTLLDEQLDELRRVDAAQMADLRLSSDTTAPGGRR
jgi:hypothetical protein